MCRIGEYASLDSKRQLRWPIHPDRLLILRVRPAGALLIGQVLQYFRVGCPSAMSDLYLVELQSGRLFLIYLPSLRISLDHIDSKRLSSASGFCPMAGSDFTIHRYLVSFGGHLMMSD